MKTDLIDQLHNKIKDGEISLQDALAQVKKSPFRTLKDISLESIEVTPLKSGFNILDQHRLFKKGRPELIVVGAGTSHGKSAFMMQIASNVAKTHPVFVFSLEMDDRDIKARLLSPASRVKLDDVVNKRYNAVEMAKAAASLDQLKLNVCTNGRKDINYIADMCHTHAKPTSPALIVVDYLQLIKGSSRNTRTAEIGQILGDLKDLARELECPVLIGSQLNRECERRGKRVEFETGQADYRPMKSDLMDSGSIEHDADVIMFISRQYVYDQTRPSEADITIAKNRNGRIGSFKLGWDGDHCQFLE